MMTASARAASLARIADRLRTAWPRLAFPSRAMAVSWVARVHPRRWLRLLRTATLTLILLTGLLSLLVSYQAHREISTATGDGAQAIREFNAASCAIGKAVSQLKRLHGQKAKDAATYVALVGSPSGYSDNFLKASRQLTLAASHNVAGPGTASDAASAGELLAGFDNQATEVTADFAAGNYKLAEAELGYPAHMGVQEFVASLLQAERTAADADLGAPWLRPWFAWSLLLAPVFALVIVTAGASYVLWRGFRRLLTVRLILANVLTLTLAVMMAVLDGHDGGNARVIMTKLPKFQAALVCAKTSHISVSGVAHAGWAYSPPVLLAGLALVALACALAYAAYLPRLAEYRYRA